MFAEVSVARRGFQSKPIEDGSIIRACHSDYEHQPSYKNKVTEVTYMDTVTTSVGWVTLSGPRQEALAQGPTIQDVMHLI